jgi:hypothetical protein
MAKNETVGSTQSDPKMLILPNGLIKSKAKKLCILGTASSTVNQAPYNDHSYDIIALGWRQDFKRANILIDIHRFDAERKGMPANYFDWLVHCGCPVYLQDKHPQIPNSVRYPIEMATARFGDYFASSIAYATALGILSGYEEIALYGIDLQDDSEYAYQRPNAEYLLGFAAGAGIKVVIPQEAMLLKYTHRYGYDRDPTLGDVSKDFLQNEMMKYTSMYDEHSKRAIAADGARQAVETILQTFHTQKKGKVE